MLLFSLLIIQGERDRPSSRQGESERPRSRADYEREYRDNYRGGTVDFNLINTVAFNLINTVDFNLINTVDFNLINTVDFNSINTGICRAPFD